MKLMVLGLLIIFISSTALTSGKSMPQSTPVTMPATPCAVAAYIIDEDPKGLNVRSGPGTKFPVIAKLPTVDEYGDPAMVELWVTGVRDGWVLFEKAGTTDTKRKLYKGKGWVYAQMLGMDISDDLDGLAKVYREPTADSPKVGEVTRQTTMKLIGCRGEWAEVEYKGIKGWLPPEVRRSFIFSPPNKK